MNRRNILFAISRVEDCLELNFKYADYQTLGHLSYSSCVCLTSVRAARAQCFLSVQVLINVSTVKNIRRAATGSCSSPIVQKSCRKLLQRGNRKQHLKNINRLSNVSNCYANHFLHKWELTLQLHYLVTG